MYDDLMDRKEFMENARRGFYCMMCSLEGQEAFYTRKRLKFFGSNSHITYHNDFCKLMTRHAFPGAYNDYKNFNVYVSNLLKVTTCYTSLTNNLNSQHIPNHNSSKEPPMSDDMKKLIKNPFNITVGWDIDKCDIQLTNGLPFFDCYDFCRHFNIARPVSLLDGDIESMGVIYDYLMQFK